MQLNMSLNAELVHRAQITIEDGEVKVASTLKTDKTESKGDKDYKDYPREKRHKKHKRADSRARRSFDEDSRRSTHRGKKNKESKPAVVIEFSGATSSKHDCIACRSNETFVKEESLN